MPYPASPATPLRRIVLASLLACAGLAATPALAQLSDPANASALAIVNDANANNRVLFVSGASAVLAGFSQIATSLFQPGTVSQFTPSAASGATATDYVAFAGRLQTAAGGWAAGTPVIIINRARGGSVWGVNPVARATVIESLAVNPTSCTTGNGSGATPFRCGLDTRVPNAGISDVAPPLFRWPLNTEGEIAADGLSPAELATLTAEPIYSLGFGVPVSNSVPDLRLTRAALSGIMAGSVGTWGQVDASLPAAVAAADMLVCRRVPGSGTQAIANLYFGNFPCTATFNAPATRDDTPAWNPATRTFTVEGDTGGLNVVELSTSGQLRACLSNAALASTRPFNAAATPAVFNPATGAITTPAVGYTTFMTADRSGRLALVQLRDGRVHAAVGLLSLDSLDRSTNLATGWSFRSLDGAGRLVWGPVVGGVQQPPVASGSGRQSTVANLVDGTWDKQGVISFNVPARTTGDLAALAAAFVAAARSPAILNSQVSLRFAAAAVAGTADTVPPTNQVQRVAFAGGDQCGPLNLLP